jgi:hypothetical protein
MALIIISSFIVWVISNSIQILTDAPNPENNAKIRYNVPMSLALQDKNHLSVHIDIFLIKYTLYWLKLITRKLIFPPPVFCCFFSRNLSLSLSFFVKRKTNKKKPKKHEVFRRDARVSTFLEPPIFYYYIIIIIKILRASLSIYYMYGPPAQSGCLRSWLCG